MTFNIHGATIYSTLSVLINSSKLDIGSEQLKDLQRKLNGVNYVIIDKKSKMEHHMLALVDFCLRIVFPKYQNQPFGDQSVILVDDFGQLHQCLMNPFTLKVLDMIYCQMMV